MKIFKIKNALTTVAILLLPLAASMIQAATFDISAAQDKNGVVGSFSTSPYQESPGQENFGLSPFEHLNINKHEGIASALIKLQSKQYDKAKEEISVLIEQMPENPDPYILQAILAEAKGKSLDAKGSYLKVLEFDANNIIANHALANLAIGEGQFKQATSYHQAILEVDSRYIKSYIALARIADREGDLNRTEIWLRKGYVLARGDFNLEHPIAIALSQVYVKLNQPEKIILLSNELARKYPNKLQVKTFQINSLIQNGHIKQAEKQLAEIIATDPSDTKHRVLLANLIAKQLGREKEVIALLKQIEVLNPEKLQTYFFISAHYLQQKNYQQALVTAQKVESLFPEFTTGKLMKAKVYLTENKFDQAISAYQQAYLQLPNNKLMVTIVELMLKQNQQTLVIDFLNKALAGQGDKNELLFLLGYVYQKQGDYEQSELYYKKVVSKQPENILALNNLAWVMFRQGKGGGALVFARQAYENSPSSAALLDTYGYMLAKQGEVAEGLKVLQKAAEISPSSTQIQAHLSEIYELNGNKK